MQKAIDILRSHEKFITNLGLERITTIMDILNNPQNNYKIIHVAGTNGKGSTAKIINEILVRNGFKTGLFTSPHLFNYEERFKVNNEDISPYVFDKLIGDINELALKHNVDLTEFELLTAAGFYYFFVKGVQYLVLETGLGGALDSTNIVKPEISIITTIDYDHTERLGKTIEKIAEQKAGIIKENVPVVVSKDNLGYEVIEKVAKEKNAPLVEIKPVTVKFNGEENIIEYDGKEYEFNLLGDYQAKNLELALAAVNSLNLGLIKVRDALRNVYWKFRLEYNKEKQVLIDSAHNPSGAKVLREFLDKNFKKEKKIFIFGCLKNKDYNKMLKTLIKKGDELYYKDFSYPSALKFKELDEKYGAKKAPSMDKIMKMEGLKIFCGSIYMLGEIFKDYHI